MGLMYHTVNNFNPLPRKEGDFATEYLQHSPLVYFNPLPRKEGDDRPVSIINGYTKFQSTPS